MQALFIRSVGRQKVNGPMCRQVRRRFSTEKPPKQPQKCRRLPRGFNSEAEDERYQLGPQQFRQLTPESRAKEIRKKYGLLESDGPDISTLAKLTENVWGAFTLGNSVVLRLEINNQVIDVPLVTEEPSVVAAIANAIKRLLENGPVMTSSDPNNHITGQIQILKGNASTIEDAIGRLKNNMDDLMAKAEALPKMQRLKQRGGGFLGEFRNHCAPQV